MTVDAWKDQLTLEEKAALTSGSVPPTCFPPAATVASSWDPSPLYEVGLAIDTVEKMAATWASRHGGTP